MQYKKDDVRMRILRAAQEEFMEHGFSGASMRRIARLAGTSTSNLYTYFPSKEALFEALVGELYASLLDLFHHHHDEGWHSPAWAVGGELETFRSFFDFIVEQRIPLILLCKKSGGSPFAGTLPLFVRAMADNILHHFKEDNTLPGHLHEPLARALARAFWEGLFTLLETHRTEEDLEELVFTYVVRSTVGGWFRGDRALSFLSQLEESHTDPRRNT
ncbi:TetR/AcrR family transcriptional regulator [Spirochaeta thermophila]|uniref:TetR/AcrR family transcriptional regulator n=1 Tax=Winmispira thermophila TaxID=154 RepID=UPI0003027A96|nr:TetR/AcrR family transcriptional regulator [Spirochaeta thermophila]